MSLTVNENEYGLTVSETPTHSLTVSGTSGPLTIASDDLSLTVSDTPTSLLTVTSSTDPSITVQDNNILLTIDQSTGSTSSANPFDQDLNTTDSPTFAAITVSGTVDGRDLSVDGTKLDGIAVQANKYVHPTYTSRSINTSGASVLDEFTSDVAGHVTNITTRTLTLADLGYTGATDANNYVLPTSFTARNINTSGAHVLDTFTSDTSGRVTGITTRPLLLADIGYTGATNADVTPSWVPSTNPNYLTAASTDLDSRYYTETELNSFLALKLSRAGGVMTGNITMSGSETVDGRDLSVDGSKLDGISAGADVTPSWVPSTNPNYLTAASTDLDSRYYTETETDQFLNLKANKLSPVFTGTPSAPTAAAGTNTTQLATTAFVGTAVAGLVDSAPTTLDTLNELAAALGDDANFSTTVTNSIATKLPLAGGQMTGNITMSGSETVDGRDLSVDGAKLDDIEEGATADQTASEILTLIKTVDGSGSGLDADTLDGISSASFLRSDADDTMSGNLTIAKTDPTITLFDNSGANTDPNGTIIFSEASGTTNFDINYNGSDDRLEFRGRIGSTLTDLIYINRSSGNVINVYGNIIVTGTVDGRDVASDGSKLDGISAGADVTPSWVPSTNPNYLTASSTDLDSRYYTETETDQLLALKAPLASPAFTGTPTAPTPSLSDDNTNIATTEYVKGQSYLTSVTASDVGLGNVTNESKATMFASPAFTGTPTAPTPSLSDNNTTIATTEYVKGQNYLTAVSTDLDSRYYTETETDQFLALKAPLASPTFTGTPTAPTPSLSDNNTTIATTEYVKGQNYLTAVSTDLDSRYYTETETDQFLALKAPLASPTFTGTPTAPTPSLSDNNTNIATTEYVKGQNYLTAVSTDLDSRYYTETEINQFLNLKLNKSGGTMTGSIDMGTNDITNAGEIEANEFIGNLRGAVSFTAKAGEALTKGDVVYISGISGNLTVVAKADADNDSKMPAFGVASETVSINANVTIINFGRVSNLDTSGFSEGDELFVSNTAGVLSSTAPSGESSALQKMAKVTRSHASSGSITVMGAGRTNAVPNLNEGRLFVGNSSNEAVADGTVHVDIANSRVGIGTTTPQTPLHVQDSAGSGIRVSRSGSSAYAQLFPAYSSVPTLMGRGAGGLHLGYESNTAGIRIDTSNNVGIGTTSPSNVLHVESTTLNNGAAAKIENTRDGGADHGLQVTANGSAGSFATRIQQQGAGDILQVLDGSTEVFTILDGGNVGIGIDSPSQKLHVKGIGIIEDASSTGFGTLQFGTNTTRYIRGNAAELQVGATIQQLHFQKTNGPAQVASSAADGTTAIQLLARNAHTSANILEVVNGNGQTADFVIDSDGKVGIGTTSPAGKLEVYTSANRHTNILGSTADLEVVSDNNTNPVALIKGVGTADLLNVFDNTTEVFTILDGGNVGIGTTNPSQKLTVESGASSTGSNTLKIIHTRSDANVATLAAFIDMHLSGADNTTADRTNAGLKVDLDSSANGDAANEHRIYGVETDVRFTGFSDISRGGYFYTESNYTGAKTTELAGVFGRAVHDANSTSGGVANMYGVYGSSSIQDLGDVDNAFGGYFSVTIANSRTANVGVTKGVEGEIQIDKDTAIDYGTMIGVSSLIDNNEDSTPNFGTQYLFRGLYAGTQGSDAYGIYVEGDKNYFEGNVGIGLSGPSRKLHIVQTSTTQGGAYVYSNAIHTGTTTSSLVSIRQDHASSTGTVLDVRGDGTGDKLIVWDNTSVSLIVKDGGNVGIGIDIPAARLELKGSTADSTANAFVARDSASASLFSIRNDGRIDATGNVVIGGNLTVNGTTTTINSTTVQVDDKNIELGTVASPTDTTADGGGITLKGTTDKTINWINSTDAWTFSERIAITPDGSASTPSITFSGDSDTGIYRFVSGSDAYIGFSTAGSQRGYFGPAGITSSANVYSATGSEFRNYGGTWKGTTGLTGNGFQFINSVDGTAMTLSSTGAMVVTSSVSVPNLTLTNLSSYSGSEVTALMIDGSNIVGKRALGSAAFSATSAFAAASHTHAASDITSGTLNADRLPRPTSGDWWNGGAVIVGTDGVMEVGKYLDFHVTDAGTSDYDVRITAASNAISVGGSVTATSLIKSGGTSSQFLKANGSVDSNTYLTTGSASSTYLPLAGGTITGNIKFNDGIELRLGAGADLKIYHNSNVSRIHNELGDLYIENDANDGDIIFGADNGSGGIGEYFRLDGSQSDSGSDYRYTRWQDFSVVALGSNNDLQLWHDGTNSRIENNVGNLIINNNTNDGDIIFKSDDGSGGVTTYLTLDGSSTGLTVSAPQGMVFFDSIKAKFGNNDDLQIYHDGSNSFIRDTGTGSLYIDGSQNVFIRDTNGQVWFQGNAGGVNLRYQDSVKIQTTTSGVSVTGSMVAHAAVVNQVTAATSSGSIKFKNNSGSDKAIILDNGNFGIGVTDPDAKLEIKGSGTGSGTALRVRNSSDNELLTVGDNGIVTVPKNYFYVSSGGGAYVQNALRVRGSLLNDQGTLSITGDVSFDSYTLYVDSAYDRVGVGSSSPSYKLDVSGGIRAGGKVTYQKSAASLDTTGYAVAGLTSSYNGDSAGFTFTCYGHTGGYQRIVYACHNVSGTTWNTQKVIDEGTNDFDVAASANGSTITFTFKSRSGTKSYTPRVVVEAAGGSVNNTYA